MKIKKLIKKLEDALRNGGFEGLMAFSKKKKIQRAVRKAVCKQHP